MSAASEDGDAETVAHVVCHDCPDCESVFEDCRTAVVRGRMHLGRTGHDVAVAEVRAR